MSTQNEKKIKNKKLNSSRKMRPLFAYSAHVPYGMESILIVLFAFRACIRILSRTLTA